MIWILLGVLFNASQVSMWLHFKYDSLLKFNGQVWKGHLYEKFWRMAKFDVRLIIWVVWFESNRQNRIVWHNFCFVGFVAVTNYSNLLHAFINTKQFTSNRKLSKAYTNQYCPHQVSIICENRRINITPDFFLNLYHSDAACHLRSWADDLVLQAL